MPTAVGAFDGSPSPGDTPVTVGMASAMAVSRSLFNGGSFATRKGGDRRLVRKPIRLNAELVLTGR
jgi:hypothetical protein